MDWNWFFSAFAQCSAALIGIIAAFIISKLLGESEKYEFLQNELEAILIRKNDLIRKINQIENNRYLRLKLNYSSKVFELIKEMGSKNNEDILKALEQNYLYISQENIEFMGIINEIKSNPLRFSQYRRFNRDFVEIEEKIKLYSTNCEKNIDELKLIIKAISNKKEQLNPISITIYFLLFGFLTTVLLPLYFLPIEIGKDPLSIFTFKILAENTLSPKGILFLLLSFCIAGILIYFLQKNRDLKSNYDSLLKKIDIKWLSTKYYIDLYKKSED